MQATTMAAETGEKGMQPNFVYPVIVESKASCLEFMIELG